MKWIVLVFLLITIFQIGYGGQPNLPYAHIQLEKATSSYQLSSVSQWHVHIRAVVFHTLHRGQIDTILCPLIS